MCFKEVIEALRTIFNKCRMKCKSKCCELEIDMKNGSTSDLSLKESKIETINI